MINFKQKELVDKLFYKIKEKFPEIELINITESPEDPNDLWVNITAPKDEEIEIELREFAGEMATDILLEYGYHISIMPTTIMPTRKLKREISKSRKTNRQK